MLVLLRKDGSFKSWMMHTLQYPPSFSNAGGERGRVLVGARESAKVSAATAPHVPVTVAVLHVPVAPVTSAVDSLREEINDHS